MTLCRIRVFGRCVGLFAGEIFRQIDAGFNPIISLGFSPICLDVDKFDIKSLQKEKKIVSSNRSW